MSGVSLNKFNQIKDDQQVVREGEKSVQPKEAVNLFGKMFKALNRSDVEKDENNKVTQSFFKALREAYGDRVTDFAIRGYESREFDGKPLTGYRIQQIIARAQSVEHLDGDALERLVGERAPSLLDESLKQAGIELPEQGRREWQQLLTGMVESEIRNSDKFKDPRKLESSSFAQEFQGVVDAFIHRHQHMLSLIGELESRRETMLAKPEDHGPWGMVSAKELDEVAFPPEWRRKFAERIGEGDDKINDLDQYWNLEIVEPTSQALAKTHGLRTSLQQAPYDGLFHSSNVRRNDGVYKAFWPDNGFAEFARLDTGMSRPNLINNVRDEKFHVSVHPEDIGRAYVVLAPILFREDCPIAYWKVSDVKAYRDRSEEAQQMLRDFEEGKDVKFKGTWNKNKLTDENQNLVRKMLAQHAEDVRRVFESCQFTLYPMNGQDSSTFIDILDEIEQALRSEGIRPVPTPETDEGVTDFVSFRIGARVDPTTGNKVRIDPHSEGYPEFKETFKSNPFFQGQSVNLVSTEIKRVLDGIEELDGDDDLQKVGALVDRARSLRQKVDAMDLDEPQRLRLEQRLEDLNLGIREHVGAPINGQVSSFGWISGLDVEPSFQQAMKRVNRSSLDGTTSARVEHLLALAGKMKTASKDPNLGLGERQQLAGDMQTVKQELDRLLDLESQRIDRDTEIDMAGKVMINNLRTLDFRIG